MCASSAASSASATASSSRYARSSPRRPTLPSSCLSRGGTSRNWTGLRVPGGRDRPSRAARTRRCLRRRRRLSRACIPPATQEGHHSWPGGLLEHTVGVASLCREAAQLHQRLRADLLLAAALLHDAGRTRELDRGPLFLPTAEGRLLGHVHLGLRLVEERANGLQPAVLAEILHAIASHHDARAARTAEATVLYHANQLDAAAAMRPVTTEANAATGSLATLVAARRGGVRRLPARRARRQRDRAWGHPRGGSEWYADDGNRGAAFFVFFLLAGRRSPSSGSSARCEASSSAPRATRPAGRPLRSEPGSRARRSCWRPPPSTSLRPPPQARMSSRSTRAPRTR